MRIAKFMIFPLVILSPVASFAFAADDAAIRESLDKHQLNIQKYAEKTQRAVPPIVNYKYGMKLDIAHVVRTSPETRVCKVVPQRMTYEDAKGELNTIQYPIMSECRGKN